MKKLTHLLSGLFLICIVATNVNATVFTDTQTLNTKLGEGFLAQLIWEDTLTYSHLTPTDFQVPYDIVNSATLAISAYWVNGNNDTVEVNGSVIGMLTPGGDFGKEWKWSWSEWKYIVVSEWDDPAVSTFDLTSTFSSWSTDDPFDVTLTAKGCGEGVLKIQSSTFTLDYENQTAPVPEPGTMMLFGIGLLGLAGISRKKLGRAIKNQS